jgi:hypothetical protein
MPNKGVANLTTQSRQKAGEIFAQLADALETGTFGSPVSVVLTTLGSELGVEELVRGAEMAQEQQPGLKVILVGPKADTGLQIIESDCEADSHRIMEELLSSGKANAAVTLHYNFPLGVSTVGRVVTPARGKPVFLATTTGTAATDRVEAMVLNAIAGIAVAKSMGMPRPRLGILNVEGARQVERILKNLAAQGYPIEFSQSVRSDGGSVLRGNDLLTGSADVVVCDTLTGNLLMKIFSAFTSGGTYEMLGWGYGPGVGANFDKVINIISRASGAPVVAAAIQYAAACSQGNLPKLADAEYKAAAQAGMSALLKKEEKQQTKEATPPAKKPVTEDIAGIDILELDDAVRALWAEDIYAETGMGCAGPVIMVAPEDKEKARAILAEKNYL